MKLAKNEALELRRNLIRILMKSVGAQGVVSIENMELEEVVEIPQEQIELEIPEYWNAENTSQRIVDFALSLYGQYGEEGGRFLEIIKSSVAEGFGEAKEIIGSMPGSVSKLVDSTYELVMKKLDDWATGQGISTEKTLEDQ